MIFRKLKGYKYELLDVEVFETTIRKISLQTPFASLSTHGILRVMPHYAWDGPSGPTIDTKTFMRGSLAHDALYQMIREEWLLPKYRVDADYLLRQVCLEDGMSKFRAWYVYKAVRLFGKKTSLPRKNPRGKIIVINKGK